MATEGTDKSVEPTPKASTLPAEAAPIVAESLVEADPAPVAEVAQITAARSLAPTASTFAAPGIVRPTPGPIATILISLLSPFGLLPPLPPVSANVVGVPADPLPGTSLINGVTGVKVGSSSLAIPVGGSTYTGAADWYFPTQADGTVQAQGVMLLQHGFLGSNFWYSALATDLAQQHQQHRGGAQHPVLRLLHLRWLHSQRRPDAAGRGCIVHRPESDVADRQRHWPPVITACCRTSSS